MYLRIKDVSMKYDNKEVLKNIGFELNEGELICVLGPSGCGKTTLLNIIGGFIPDYEGDIVLSHKNVIENVSYGLKFLKLSKNEILEKSKDVLKKVGLEGYDKKRISELSGGEQQRVAIARSLVLNPKVLLLDEPFSNLDVHLRGVMRDEVKRIQKQFGITMIVVTHDQEDAFRLADRIVVLNNGKIEQIGTPKELYLKPKTEFVAKFIGDSNIIDSEKIVRYENVKLLKSETSDDVIIEKIFFGSVIEYKIQTYKYGIITALRLSSEAEFEVGERVEVKI